MRRLLRILAWAVLAMGGLAAARSPLPMPTALQPAVPAPGAAPASAALASPSGPAGRVARGPKQRRVFQGRASFYGRSLAGRRTASGERFNPNAMTMAHRSLPFGTWVKVIHPRTRRSVVVRVNDRGPFVRGRVADLSLAAARRLGMVRHGVQHLRFEVLGRKPPAKATPPQRPASPQS